MALLRVAVTQLGSASPGAARALVEVNRAKARSFFTRPPASPALRRRVSRPSTNKAAGNTGSGPLLAQVQPFGGSSAGGGSPATMLSLSSSRKSAMPSPSLSPVPSSGPSLTPSPSLSRSLNEGVPSPSGSAEPARSDAAFSSAVKRPSLSSSGSRASMMTSRSVSRGAATSLTSRSSPTPSSSLSALLGLVPSSASSELLRPSLSSSSFWGRLLSMASR